MHLSAPASLTGILDGILHGLERSAPVKIIHRLLSASKSLVRDVVPQTPRQAAAIAALLLTLNIVALDPHQGQNCSRGLR